MNEHAPYRVIPIQDPVTKRTHAVEGPGAYRSTHETNDAASFRAADLNCAFREGIRAAQTKGKPQETVAWLEGHAAGMKLAKSPIAEAAAERIDASAPAPRTESFIGNELNNRPLLPTDAASPPAARMPVGV